MLRPAIAVTALLLAGALLPVVAARRSPTPVPESSLPISPRLAPLESGATRALPGDPVEAPTSTGTECVQAWYAARGNFFMRTVPDTAPCGPAVALRGLVRTFSDRVARRVHSAGAVYDTNGLILDTCGSNTGPDARLVGDRSSRRRREARCAVQPGARLSEHGIQLTYLEHWPSGRTGLAG